MPLVRRDIHSSLPLQTLLYYNIWYSAMFIPLMLFIYLHKTATYDVDEEFVIVAPILGGLFTLIEAGRIRLGYVGNLKEKIPELSAFLLLTCFPTIGLIVFLTFIQMPMLPPEPIIGFPLLLIMVLEIIFSYQGVRLLIKKQTAAFFRLCQDNPKAAGGAAAAADGGLGDTITGSL
mmetsp:Transcript_26304/g.91497  ORF Transcript_26304/g.91497 Transcript_26304/m.91497 type:complete len:176 (-) Transcript_26304:83-610(-)